MNLGPTELLIIFLIILLIFGGAKLPKLAKSLGEAKREFEKSVDDDSPAAPKPVDPASHSSREDDLSQREEALRQREEELRRSGGDQPT